MLRNSVLARRRWPKPAERLLARSRQKSPRFGTRETPRPPTRCKPDVSRFQSMARPSRSLRRPEWEERTSLFVPLISKPPSRTWRWPIPKLNLPPRVGRRPRRQILSCKRPLQRISLASPRSRLRPQWFPGGSPEPLHFLSRFRLGPAGAGAAHLLSGRARDL